MSQPTPSAQQLVQALLARGLTIRQLATECARDPSLLYQVAAGKRPGNNLVGTLASIARTGYANQRPPRRTAASGQPVRIRAGSGQPARQPPPPPPTAPTPGRFSVQTTFLSGGGRTRRITAPKSSNVGRADAKQATLDAIAESAREQRKVSFVVHYEDGSSRTLGSKGGYRGDVAYTRAFAEYQDGFAWLSNEVNAVVARIGSPEIKERITGVDVTIFGQPDPLQPVPRRLRRPTPTPSAPAKKTPAKKTPAKKTPGKKTPRGAQ